LPLDTKKRAGPDCFRRKGREEKRKEKQDPRSRKDEERAENKSRLRVEEIKEASHVLLIEGTKKEKLLRSDAREGG